MVETNDPVHEPSALSRKLRWISLLCASLYKLALLPLLARWTDTSPPHFTAHIALPVYLSFLPYALIFASIEEVYRSGRRRNPSLGGHTALLDGRTTGISNIFDVFRYTISHTECRL